MSEPAKETWGVGGAYDQFAGRWSRVMAREFLAWLAMPPGQTWGDVGCGTGALVDCILRVGQPAAIYAIDRSKGFLATAQSSIKDPRAKFSAADATALPWADRCCGVTISGLVLNFVPDAARMAREMARVTKPKGQVAVYVWDYSGGMQMIRHFWDVAAQVDPRAAALDQGERFPICRPEPLKRLFEETGMEKVEARAIDIPMDFRDFDDFWLPFLGKQGAAPTYLAGLSQELSDQIRERLKTRLPAAADGSIHLTARAWAVRGTV